MFKNLSENSFVWLKNIGFISFEQTILNRSFFCSFYNNDNFVQLSEESKLFVNRYFFSDRYVHEHLRSLSKMLLVQQNDSNLFTYILFSHFFYFLAKNFLGHHGPSSDGVFSTYIVHCKLRFISIN